MLRVNLLQLARPMFRSIILRAALGLVHTSDKIDSTLSILSPVDKIDRAGDKIDCTVDYVDCTGEKIDRAVDFVASVYGAGDKVASS